MIRICARIRGRGAGGVRDGGQSAQRSGDLASSLSCRRTFGAIIRLWENAWNEFIPFLDYDVEIRKVICSTNASRSTPATGGQSRPWARNQRAGRAEVPLPGAPVP